MNYSQLESRIRRLEDMEEIRALMMRYAKIINKGWNGEVVNADEMPTVFAKNARWTMKELGIVANGIEEIIDGLLRETKIIEFSQHIFVNPVLEVNGDFASGTWLMWIASRQDGGQRFVWISEDVTYTRELQGWRIQTMDLALGGMAPLGSPPQFGRPQAE